MAFDITVIADIASKQSNITPQIVLEIEGVPTVYGNTPLLKKLEYGDAGVVYGNDYVYGGDIPIADQSDLISLSSGTTTSITQQLNQDKGIGDSISTMNISLVDKDNEISNLISPGNVVTELLGRRCKVYFGFEGTSFKDDFIIIFRGNLSDIVSSAGMVTFKINHPDDKKRTNLFKQVETTLDGALTSGATVADVTEDSSTDFLEKITGPSGSIDTDFLTYIKINDEVMQYETVTPGSGVPDQFGTLTRGQLGTVAAAHADGDTVTSFYRIKGNAIDIALRLMLSGRAGPFEEGYSLTNFVRISGTETVADSIYFQDIDIEKELNIKIGDYITTTGASNGANNVSLKAIDGITVTDLGSYITVDGVTFVEENDSAGVIDFRSQYDVWPDGMNFHSDECDIAEHLSKQTQFFSGYSYDFYIDDTMDDPKDFLSTQVYLPIAAFSLPRKSQASLGHHFPPLPTSTIKNINSDNVKSPDKLKLTRSLNRNFYNSIVYKFDRQTLEEKFNSGTVAIDGDSQTRFGPNVNNKTLTIEALGMRTDLSAVANATSATSRRLAKYKFGAEEIKDLRVSFGEGYALEVGDIVLLDIASLKITDILTGTRAGESRLFEITNKSLNIKTGDISINVVDTSFDKDARYGLVSPASFVKSGSSTTEFVIEASFNTSVFGVNEFRKWETYVGAKVVIRSVDFSTSDTSVIDNIAGNTITLTTALSFTPSAGYLMELDHYDGQPDNVKLVYTFMQDNATFADGKVQYQMI